MNNTSDNSNPLSDLYTSSGPVDIKEIASTFKKFVAIQDGTEKIYLKDGGIHLTAVQKVIAYALIKKMLKELNKKELSSVTPTEIEAEIGLKRGTIDPTFKTLKDKGLLLKTETGYEIPNFVIKQIIDEFKNI